MAKSADAHRGRCRRRKIRLHCRSECRYSPVCSSRMIIRSTKILLYNSLFLFYGTEKRFLYKKSDTASLSRRIQKHIIENLSILTFALESDFASFRRALSAVGSRRAVSSLRRDSIATAHRSVFSRPLRCAWRAAHS